MSLNMEDEPYGWPYNESDNDVVRIGDEVTAAHHMERIAGLVTHVSPSVGGGTVITMRIADGSVLSKAAILDRVMLSPRRR